MPMVRIAAFAALILTVALALLSLIPGNALDSGLILLAIAAANAGLVVILTRVRPTGLAGAGLWLVLVGVLGMLVAVTSPYWVEGLLPRGDTIEDIFARFDTALSAVLVPFWIGVVALVIGWVLWIASRIAARRAARVASRPRHPI